ncbi:MAG: hypothetical protein AB1Z19_01545 [Eubacteriales bacterium]
MGKYIIAIGGTGIKCLESFLHISAFGGFGSGKDVYHVMVVEGDRANGNKTRLQSGIANYITCQRTFHPNGVDTQADLSRKENKEIEKRVKRGLFRDRYIVDTKEGKDAFYVWEPDKDKDSLAEMAEPAGENTKGLMEVLFTENELNRNLHVGFEGHPNIGSLTMDHLMNLNDPDSPWYNFIGLGNNEIPESEQTDIIIMGSVYGGTGAAGIYAVANKIKSYKYQNKEKTVNVDYERLINDGRMRVGVVMMLPYFLLPSPETTTSMGANNMMENTAYALDYYAKKPKFLSDLSLILIGKSNREPIVEDIKSGTGKWAPGDMNQKNKSMTPEVIAAFAMNSFFAQQIDKGRVTYVLRKKEVTDLNSPGSLLVDWDSIPITDGYQKKLSTMLVFALTYIAKINPVLQRGITDTARYHWLGKCVNDMDPDLQMQARQIGDYLKSFVDWALDVSSAGERSRDEYRLLNYAKVEQLMTARYDEDTDYSFLVRRVHQKSSWNRILEKLISGATVLPKDNNRLGLHRLFIDLFDSVNR